MKQKHRLFTWSALIWGIFIAGGFLFFLYGNRTYGLKNANKADTLETIHSLQKSPDSQAGKIEKEKKGENYSKKVAYLTFDDGPSNHSDRLLDILKEEGVKATFFVVGKEGEEAEHIYKRIVKEGHGLGLHSYSHVYSQIYSSLDEYKEDVWKLKTFLYHVTGVSCDIYRFPGGSSNSMMKIPIDDCKSYLEEKNIRYYNWNSSAEDAVCVGTDPGVLLTRVLKDALKHEKTVILMHDLNCCETTLNIVKPLINRLKKEGYIFERLTHDMEPLCQ